jgi:hypothetical protein
MRDDPTITELVIAVDILNVDVTSTVDNRLDVKKLVVVNCCATSDVVINVEGLIVLVTRFDICIISEGVNSSLFDIITELVETG